MGEGITANQLQSGVVTFLSQPFEFNNAEILQILGGAPKNLLPSPGANKANGILAIIFTLDTTVGAYNFTGDALLSAFGEGSSVALIGGAFREEAAEASPLFINGNADRSTVTLRGKFLVGGDGSPSDEFADKALQFALTAAMTGISGGHANNTLTVTVLYTVLDV